MKFLLFFFISIHITMISRSQDFGIRHEINTSTFILENAFIKRVIFYDKDRHALYTTGFSLNSSNYEYSRPGSREFSFAVDGIHINGGTGCGCMDFIDFLIIKEEKLQRLTLTLSGHKGSVAQGIEVIINYEIYPDQAAIRKWILINNQLEREILLTDLLWENLMLDPLGWSQTDIYKEFGKSWTKPPYEGGKDDPALVIVGSKGSIILGNESPGIMKYTPVYRNEGQVGIGMNPSGHNYAFARRLSPGESFQSPKSFIILSDLYEPDECFEKELQPFVVNHMDVKVFQREKVPLFLYDTWNPFRTRIDDSLICEIADSLQATGAEYLIIDDGWQDRNGDWNVDLTKFPRGLKPVCDHIKSRGMKAGIWISLTVVEKESQAFRDYRQYAILDKDGSPTNLHGWSDDRDIVAMNLASPWYDYMLDKISSLINENGFDYVKIDLSVVKSAYIMETERSGNYAVTPESGGREESLYLGYEKMMGFFDDLLVKCPDLIIDCSFELWGDWHSIDFALVQHAHVDWLSNLEDDPPLGSRNVRTLAWRRAMVVPAAALVIGNQRLEAHGHELSFLSNFCAVPIMLGDPRQLTVEEKAWYKAKHKWLREMEDKYYFSRYYQVTGLPGYPARDGWDGFARFNPETNGGILCVFRNESPEIQRTIHLPWLQHHSTYALYNSETGKMLAKDTGYSMAQQGVMIKIKDKNSGIAIEIRPVK